MCRWIFDKGTPEQRTEVHQCEMVLKGTATVNGRDFTVYACANPNCNLVEGSFQGRRMYLEEFIDWIRDTKKGSYVPYTPKKSRRELLTCLTIH